MRILIITCLSLLGTIGFAFAQKQTTICQGDSAVLTTTAADLIEWLPHAGLSDPYIPQPKASPATTTSYLARRLKTSDNLIKNGDFEAGATQFQTEYKDSTKIEIEGYFAITTNPSKNHHAMNPCVDHTTGSSKFMAVNGTPVANKVVWSQTIAVSPNTNYAFSAYVNAGISSGSNQAILQFSINGQLLNEPYLSKYNVCTWERFFATWNSGPATSAVISVVNQNLERKGNDFGLDDLYFQSFTTLTDSTLVVVKPEEAAPAVTLRGSDVPCQGDTAFLSGPSGTSAYLWSNGSTKQTISVTKDGVFSLRIKGTNGCFSLPSDFKTINVQPIPNAPVVSVLPGYLTSICPDDSTVLDATSDYGYLWSNGFSGKNPIVKTAGTYTVRAISGQGCFSVPSNGITVSVRPRISQPKVSLSGDSVVCAPGTLTITSSFSQYNFWSTGATTQAITVSDPGKFWVYAKSPTGCASYKRYINVGIGGANKKPVVTPKSSTSLCPGQSVVLESNFPSGNKWSTGAMTPTITVSSAGSYTLTVTNTCGTSISDPVAVSVKAVPQAPVISAPVDRDLCSGESIVLTSSASNHNIWSTGDTTQTITVYRTGNFTVYQNYGKCTTATSTPLLVNVSAKPLAPTIISYGPTAFCDGNSVYLISNYPTRNVWSNGATTQILKVTTPGNYYVQQSSSACRSDTSNNILVEVANAPDAPTINYAKLKGCKGDLIALSTSSSLPVIWNTGEVTTTIGITSIGYSPVTVRAKGTNGCLSQPSKTVYVLIDNYPDLPTITPLGSQTICQNAGLLLSSNSPVRTAWSSGDTAASITVRKAGSYTARAISAAGCTSAVTAAVVVSIETPLDQPTVLALGHDSLQSSVVGTKYVWRRDGVSLPDSTREIVATQSGSYTVTAYSANKCPSPESVALPVTVTSIAERWAAQRLAVTPNPAKSVVWVSGKYAISGITVLDAAGHTVLKQAATSSIKVQILVENLPAGVYTLKAESIDGLLFGRFVKE